MLKLLSNLLCHKKGETLLEVLASILLFSILMLLLATVISFSVKLNAHTNLLANELQEEINVINEDAIPIKISATIEFVPSNLSIAKQTQKIVVTDNAAQNSLVAFRPVD